MDIIPSILTNDPRQALEFIRWAEGAVSRLSIDIIDGKYAENKTVYPDLLEDVETTLLLDFQLMVEEPVNWIEKCLLGQADRIIGHVEQMEDQEEFVSRLQEAGVGVGLGIDLDTPITKIERQLLGRLDVVLVMSVKAGFGGQKFSNDAFGKIRELMQAREEENATFKIHVDGGVTAANIKDVSLAGADEVSVGIRIFDGDLRENIEKLMKAV